MSDSPPKGSGSKVDPVNYDDPLYIHPSDNTVTTIVSFILTGTDNIRVWRSSMVRSLKARNKLGFVEGIVKKDSTDELKSSKWERANAVVCSWILGSLSESIYSGHAYSESAVDIWNELFEIYNKADGSFLNGLDDSFNQVKSHILLLDPLPNVKTAFSIVSREESHQKNEALTSISNGHLIDRCYKLIGYPKDFKPRNKLNNDNQRNQNKTFSVNSSYVPSSSSFASGSSGTYSFTSEQYNKLLSLISENSSASEDTSVSANMAGIPLLHSYNSTVGHQKWIDDSGANQHMTSSESLLQDTVDVSKLNLLVNHPNGSAAKIEKTENLQFSEKLTLFDVFSIPNFNVNLPFVHKLCKDTNCEIVFDENCCKIQDLQSKKVVENGRESGGLLGHPTEQALNSLKHTLNFDNSSLPPCEVKIVRSDNGAEFLSHKMKSFFELHGVIHQTSCVYTPHQNGIVERKHRHILNVARMPTSVLKGQSPYQLVFKKKPIFDHLRVFGSLCFATKLNNLDKFSEHAEKCVLLGYSSEKKDNSEYVNDVIDLNDLSVNHQMDGSNATHNLNETFFDTTLENINQTSGVSKPLSDRTMPSHSDSTEENSHFDSLPFLGQPLGVSRSRRESRMPVKFNDYIVEGRHKYGIEHTLNYSVLSTENKCFCSNLNKTIEPKSFEEASLDPNWVESMNNEMEALYRNHTWDIVDLPKKQKPIGFRVVITLAVNKYWPLYQLDINNAFICGDLTEDVYMNLPQGYHTKVYVDDIILTGSNEVEIQNILSQFMHKPHKSHLNITFRLLRYLKGSPGKGVSIAKSKNLDLMGYVDADWAKCLNSRKLVTRYLVYFANSLVSWKRIKNLVPVTVFCDNEYAIKLALNPVFQEKTKHFEIDLHFVREKITRELGKRNTLVVSELREVVGFGRKIAGKWRDGDGSTLKSGNGSEEILSGVCRERKMVKNGGGLAGFRPVELQEIEF
ncbi:uncharacterized protein LOC111911314 [Lactuca sativa]|uniref:uncharacterized protein LOC111911314 n=1 Tax=Lactuca sativa TaxID=4236 RepID=UPI0022B0336C|nr:uncharacterized protein LOC111911314 [Lactuca sativa]